MNYLGIVRPHQIATTFSFNQNTYEREIRLTDRLTDDQNSGESTVLNGFKFAQELRFRIRRRMT